MIALSSVIGKTYHLIISRRITDFLVKNGIINPSVQKAFLPGISGCFEHNNIMLEMIKSSRINKKTLHITCFDLADAFGSVPHELISRSTRRAHLPNNIQLYITNLYNGGKAVVKTNECCSTPFSFKRGVFQGDPLSPIIFLLAFNPILEFILKNEKIGYKINDQSIKTLPFADDFCLISTNKKTHQNIINEINKKIESMGLRLKPAKCRSFNLTSGKPEKVHFNIGEATVPSIADEEQLFL